MTVYAYAQPRDMRKGFDGLSALVTEGLQRDPLNGAVYLFVSRDRVRAKVLHWAGTGLCIYAKRLERGRFARLWRDEGDTPITLTVSELDPRSTTGRMQHEQDLTDLLVADRCRHADTGGRGRLQMTSDGFRMEPELGGDSLLRQALTS